MTEQTPLTQDQVRFALVREAGWTEAEADEALAEIEAAAARRAIEGSGVVPECEFPDPCCYRNHEYDEECTLPPVKVVFTETLAALPRPEEPRVERAMPDGASFAWHAEPHGKEALCYGCRHHIGWHMAQCGCKEAPWCVPHPADDAHQWASLCRLPHDHVAAEEPRVERCAVCGTPIAEHPLTDACAIAQESEAR